MAGYITVSNEGEAEQVIKKSRFIGRCYHVTSEEAALSLIEKLKKHHWDASHNCYAYIIGKDVPTARYSDDGEPQGTAGVPILDVLQKKGATDVLAVVTRYFGGVLLGAGGLVRAYSGTAALAVEKAGVCRMTECYVYRLNVEYPLWGKIEAYLASERYSIREIEFKAGVETSVLVPKGGEGAFLKRIADLSCGKLTAENVGTEFEQRAL